MRRHLGASKRLKKKSAMIQRATPVARDIFSRKLKSMSGRNDGRTFFPPLVLLKVAQERLYYILTPTLKN